MGTIGADGKFTFTRQVATKDIGSWTEQWKVGTDPATAIKFSDLSFNVVASIAAVTTTTTSSVLPAGFMIQVGGIPTGTPLPNGLSVDVYGNIVDSTGKIIYTAAQNKAGGTVNSTGQLIPGSTTTGTGTNNGVTVGTSLGGTTTTTQSAYITSITALDSNGNNSSGVLKTGYTIEIAGSNLSGVYNKFTLNVNGQDYNISRVNVTNNKITLYPVFDASIPNGSVVKVKLDTSLAGVNSGLVNNVSFIYLTNTTTAGTTTTTGTGTTTTTGTGTTTIVGGVATPNLQLTSGSQSVQNGAVVPLAIGQSVAINGSVTVYDTVTSNFTATSSNSTVARVTNNSGVVTITAMTAGYSTITFHPTASGTSTAQDKVVFVNVAAPVASTTTTTADPNGDSEVENTEDETDTTSVTLMVSASTATVTAGSSTTITASVMNNGAVNHSVTAVSDSSNVLVSVSSASGIITLNGITPGIAHLTIHPTDLASSDTSQDQIVTVTVTAPASTGSTGGSTGGTTGSTGGTTGTTGGTTGGTTTGTSASTVTDLQNTVITLNNQISQLQSQITALNTRIANQTTSGGTVYVSSTDTTQLSNLQNQVSQLTNLVQRLQSGQITTYGQASQPFQSLQMPVYSSGSTSQGLQMPAGYDASNGGPAFFGQQNQGYNTTTQGLQYQAPAQVQGATTAGTYTVKKGDTLFSIAKKYYGNGSQWRKVLSANPKCLSKAGNTKTLKIGFVLNMPSL